MRSPILAVIILASGAVDASAAYTIKTSDGAVARIGAFNPNRDPLLSAAQRVFGAPSSIRDRGGDSCQVEWSRLRLRIDFVNLGGYNACDPSKGRAQSFTVEGRRFRTWRGLRVGHRSASILDRHSSAVFRQRAWWLRTAVSPYGDNSEYGVVRAIVARGRVRALKGWIGAAGE